MNVLRATTIETARATILSLVAYSPPLPVLLSICPCGMRFASVSDAHYMKTRMVLRTSGRSSEFMRARNFFDARGFNARTADRAIGEANYQKLARRTGENPQRHVLSMVTGIIRAGHSALLNFSVLHKIEAFLNRQEWR